MKTETKPTIDLPPAPPVVETALYEGDPFIDVYVAGLAVPAGADMAPGPTWTGPDNPEGWYMLLRRETAANGSEYVWLDRGHTNGPDEDSFFAHPPRPKPFRVLASKIKRTRKLSWYSNFAYNPWGPNAMAQWWRNNIVNLFGPEAAQSEWDRIQALGATSEERVAVWLAEKTAFIEAGLIPDN
jgi:hypothetical protein